MLEVNFTHGINSKIRGKYMSKCFIGLSFDWLLQAFLSLVDLGCSPDFPGLLFMSRRQPNKHEIDE